MFTVQLNLVMLKLGTINGQRASLLVEYQYLNSIYNYCSFKFNIVSAWFFNRAVITGLTLIYCLCYNYKEKPLCSRGQEQQARTNLLSPSSPLRVSLQATLHSTLSSQACWDIYLNKVKLNKFSTSFNVCISRTESNNSNKS